MIFQNVGVVGALEMCELIQMGTACGRRKKMQRQSLSKNQQLGVNQSWFSRATEQIGCIYTYREEVKEAGEIFSFV